MEDKISKTREVEAKDSNLYTSWSLPAKIVSIAVSQMEDVGGFFGLFLLLANIFQSFSIVDLKRNATKSLDKLNYMKLLILEILLFFW